MKRLLIGIFSCLSGLAGAQVDEGGEKTAAEAGGGAPYEGKVVVIEVGTKEMSDLRKFQHWEKVVKQAEAEKARALVFRINVEGGYVDATLKLIGQIADSAVPSYAFVDGKALGVGALLAVATDTIYVKPDALIGGGGLLKGSVDEDANRQLQSVLMAKLRTVTGRQGHNREIVEALMVPAGESKVLGSVSVTKGSVLTLTGEEAISPFEGKPILAKGLADNLEAMLDAAGLAGIPQVTGTVKSDARGKIVPLEDRQGIEKGKAVEKGEELGRAREESFEGKIVVLKIGESDLMNKQSFKFWRRMLRRAEEEKAAAVVFDLDTPGGYAFKTKEMMTEITRLKIPSYAFVNEDALSAGALVSVATDGIYMNPDSLIGAAGLVSGTGAPIEETMRDKLHSVFTKHVQTVAEKKGYDAELIKAMMIADEEKDRVFGEVVVKKGELLTLTANEATSLRDGKPLLAKAIVTSIEEIAELEGLGGVPIVRAEPTPFEHFAWWVAKYSFLLILVGMGAAYAEMKAPGFGIGGAISLTAFAIFFFGNYVAGNLAGYEMVSLFGLGVLLIVVEIFLIPGTGIAGLIGAICIVGALLFGMVDKVEWGDWRVGDFSGGLLDLLRGPVLSLGAGLLGGTILIILLMRYLPQVPIFRFLIVERESASGASLPDSAAAGHEERVGWTGEALTDLRPAGKAHVGDDTMDVVAHDGAFIPKGAKVRIVEEDGMRVVVSQIENIEAG